MEFVGRLGITVDCFAIGVGSCHSSGYAGADIAALDNVLIETEC